MVYIVVQTYYACYNQSKAQLIIIRFYIDFGLFLWPNMETNILETMALMNATFIPSIQVGEDAETAFEAREYG